jgi:hypothetical protein
MLSIHQSSPISLKDMRHHIYEKLKSKQSFIQGEIYNYIEMKDISHTKNANGIYVNISTLDEIYVKDIYNMICYHKQHSEQPHQLESICTEVYEKPAVHYQPYLLTSFQERLVNLICSS